MLLLAGCDQGAQTSGNGTIKVVGEDDFAAEVLQASSPVMVDFFATWCGPCKILAPVMEEAAVEFTNRVKFVKVDVDKAPDLARQYNIQAVPTLMLFKQGRGSQFHVGVISRKELSQRLSQEAESPANP